MHYLQEVINYINGIPSSEWTALLGYLGGSTLVAGVLQVAKHKLNFAEAQKLVVVALGFLSFLAAFADFLLQNLPTANAIPWLAHVTSLLMAGAVVLHRFAVSPAYYSVVGRLQKLSDLIKEVEAEQKTSKGVEAAGEAAASVPLEEANLAQFQV